ncbi:Crp/Fnr family transcriptional regulator [Cellvibrio japonicus]|nr:cyclic nucleotide-binding domain-containing protein [Cellvibrio japonicus]QEI11209.1 cyclic nucleotide-binding domain-containing protein [Cellvibrio japonicus]QEI14783.1 cyclic nucleotide-binding domain-containing protein [Cellvibrio japonicus]QEI18363.1 cyclic nucleotide-binding domain-containing protein [Cellvibrio japonicus]
MHLPSKQSETLSDLAAKLSALGDLLCADLPAERARISPGNDLFNDRPTTEILRLVDGQAEYLVNGKLVLAGDAGDILGLPRSLNLPYGEWRNQEPIEVDIYTRDGLVNHINSDSKRQRHWAHYLLCLQSFYEQALAQETPAAFQPSAGFLHFQAGETIIRQGDNADRVYTLLEGSADALCDGVKVGEINPNEIFGALAVFTRQPRMASIVASSDCTLLAVRKEEFIDLIEHQPQICLSLIEEMAAKINQLNGQLRDLKNE